MSQVHVAKPWTGLLALVAVTVHGLNSAHYCPAKRDKHRPSQIVKVVQCIQEYTHWAICKIIKQYSFIFPNGSDRRLMVATWQSGSIVGCINEVTVGLPRARLVLGWVTVFSGHKPPEYFTKSPRPTQPPTLSGMGNEDQPKYGDALRLGSKSGIVHSACR